jgi:RNA polymerase sigma factor (sigma-70 family)
MAVAASRIEGDGSQTQPSPSAPLEVVETKNRVHRALDALPERQRIVLEWKYLDGLSVREMAERLGETEKAIESVLYRARREFRRLFDVQPLLDPVLIKNVAAPTEDTAHS